MPDDYPQELSEPIVFWPGGFGLKGNQEEVLPEETRKLRMLCDFFSIPPDEPDSEFLLALSLARKHVPGFKRIDAKTLASKKVGTPRKWSPSKELDLYLNVTRKAKSSGLSERAACNLLVKEKNGAYSEKKLNTIYRRFMKVKKNSPYAAAIRSGHKEIEVRKLIALNNLKELGTLLGSGKDGRSFRKSLRMVEGFLRVGFESHAARANLRTRSMTEAA